MRIRFSSVSVLDWIGIICCRRAPTRTGKIVTGASMKQSHNRREYAARLRRAPRRSTLAFLPGAAIAKAHFCISRGA